MAKRTQPTTPEPITKDELGNFLLWFYAQPGYCDIVARWREDFAGAAHPQPTARTKE